MNTVLSSIVPDVLALVIIIFDKPLAGAIREILESILDNEPAVDQWGKIARAVPDIEWIVFQRSFFVPGLVALTAMISVLIVHGGRVYSVATVVILLVVAFDYICCTSATNNSRPRTKKRHRVLILSMIFICIGMKITMSLNGEFLQSSSVTDSDLSGTNSED